MKIYSYLVAFVLLTPVFVSGQAEITFKDKIHDFGEIKEASGSVENKFIFTNTGKAPLIISNVKASCGCTTPGWTKEPVMPGKEGYIIAKYNPVNRPGVFNKSLTITSNASNQTEVIYIKGRVIPKPASIEDKLPTEMGNVRVRYHGLNLGRITTEKPVSRNFEIYNNGDQPISVKNVTGIPDYIKVVVSPTTLPPKSEGMIKVTYDPAASGKFGFVSNGITIQTNDRDMPEKNFTVMATIQEYFPPMSSEELAKAAKLEIVDQTYDFGSIIEGTTVEKVFALKNTGKSDLEIRSIKPNCGCIVDEMKSNTIAAGETAELTIQFNTRSRRGNQIKKVDIFSNDPKSPIQTITIKANIAEATGSR